MARKRPSTRPADLSPDTQVKGLTGEDLQKDMSEDEKTNAALSGGGTYRAVNRALTPSTSVTVGDVNAAVRRKQVKIAGMRKARG